MKTEDNDNIPTTSPAEIEELIKRVEAGTITESDKNLVVRLLKMVLGVQESLKSKKATLLKLKALIFGNGRQKQKPSGNDESASQDNPDESGPNEGGDQVQGRHKADESDETDNDISEGAQTQAEDGAGEPGQLKRKGHGRLGADDYKSAETVECRHDILRPGEKCPRPGCTGRLYDTKAPQIFIRLEGNPIVEATRYEQQVLRCSICEFRFAAKLPAGVSPEKYDATADAIIALMKYGLGMPWYRQEKMQRLLGVPLPASTQFERCEAVAASFQPVYLLLKQVAARGEVWYSDDTSVKILALLKENEGLTDNDRQGMHTSGMVSKVGDYKVATYTSGRQHAGENMADLARLRPPDLPPPIYMADAEKKNWVGDFKRIVAKCLQHGRRKFTEQEANFPIECRHVVAALAAVYTNEAQTHQMTSLQRLLHHQARSKPILDDLRQWIHKQLDERKVEPNSGLGKALQYMLTHWNGLTTFMVVEQAPLDNNLVERILKLVVLTRKNSLFFKTEKGAVIGDILMSVIQTCALNKVNPFDYLVKVIRNAGAVRSNPARWLPWSYQECER